MQYDQHHLSPDRHRYAVHDLVSPHSLLANKVEIYGVDHCRGYVSAELLGAISTADRPVQICDCSRGVYLWDHCDTKLITNSWDGDRL